MLSFGLLPMFVAVVVFARLLWALLLAVSPILEDRDL